MASVTPGVKITMGIIFISGLQLAFNCNHVTCLLTYIKLTVWRPLLCPNPRVGAISNDAHLTSVCLSRTSSRRLEQRGLGRLNIGTEVAHVNIFEGFDLGLVLRFVLLSLYVFGVCAHMLMYMCVVMQCLVWTVLWNG